MSKGWVLQNADMISYIFSTDLRSCKEVLLPHCYEEIFPPSCLFIISLCMPFLIIQSINCTKLKFYLNINFIFEIFSDIKSQN